MVTLHCIVDNSVQHASPLWGEHGVSFAIETPAGRILFDTGQSGDVLAHNAPLMELPLEQFDALALSHAHNDHTGGLERFLTFVKPGMPLFANPSLFQERFQRKDGQYKSVGLRLSREELARRFDLRLSAAPAEILPGVWTTGEITDRSEFQGSSPDLFVQENGELLPDTYRDDLSLVLDTREGLVVVCGCCHAGLLNTLSHVRRTFQKGIRAVIGGTHLVSASPEIMEHAVQALGSFFIDGTVRLYPNHCTGERASLALALAFPECVQSCRAGTVLRFE